MTVGGKLKSSIKITQKGSDAGIGSEVGFDAALKPGLDAQTTRLVYSMNIASGLVTIADALILLGTGFGIFWYYVGLGSPIFLDYALAMVLVTTTVVVAFSQANLYSVETICNPKGHMHKILGIGAVTFLSFLAIAFALKIVGDFSRVWVFSWFLLSCLLIFLERSLCRFLFWRWAHMGRVSHKIVIVGAGEQAKKFLEQMQSAKEPWLEVAGVFDDRKERIGPSFMGYQILGTVDDLLCYARKHRVDDIVISLPWNAYHRILDLTKKLGELPIHIRLGSDLAGFVHLFPSFSFISGVPMLHLVNKPLDGWTYVWKMIEDKILGLLILALLSPILLIIALAIKLESPGPVFFRQKRYGFNNNEFMIYKFRSMYHGRPPEKGVPQATKTDPRITRVGAFLRRTSLDELPQLFNVLNGTMSVVGPRPHAVEHNEEYSRIINGYFARHRVKPGITGWAQVNGWRGETEVPEKMRARVEHDIYYIENWSLLFDAKILAMTASVVASQKNAY
ncbi:MAG: undecaprenyl-phosphate glucose phosphotransferase [Nitrospinaceae bacterium]|nr:MAG: undecaprenyl-phosphate glucose phosphotransferase [Nitrospinaceae bacterium]